MRLPDALETKSIASFTLEHREHSVIKDNLTSSLHTSEIPTGITSTLRLSRDNYNSVVKALDTV